MIGNDVEKKLCRKCGVVKDTSSFHRHKKYKFQSICKECKASYARENKDAIAERQHEYWISNKETLSKYRAEWYLENIETARKNAKENYQKNSTERKSKARSYAIENSEKVKKTKKEYYENNKDVFMASSRNRRARNRGASGSHTKDDIILILTMQNDKCAWCRSRLNGKYHIDHIQPLSKGGSNFPNNLQILCAKCNLRKGPKDPIDFARDDGRLL